MVGYKARQRRKRWKERNKAANLGQAGSITADTGATGQQASGSTGNNPQTAQTTAELLSSVPDAERVPASAGGTDYVTKSDLSIVSKAITEGWFFSERFPIELDAEDFARIRQSRQLKPIERVVVNVLNFIHSSDAASKAIGCRLFMQMHSKNAELEKSRFGSFARRGDTGTVPDHCLPRPGEAAKAAAMEQMASEGVASVAAVAVIKSPGAVIVGRTHISRVIIELPDNGRRPK
jgi:hypothetical protein